MKKLFLCLFVATCFFSCSDDDENESIRLTGNTETSQVVYADETNKPEGIKFTATASWTATVKNVPTTRNSEVNWLSLNMYSGDAGEYTLTMTLQPNLTGQDRGAEIIITCADTVIRIRVEQKGTKADGEKPEGTEKRFVDNIIYKWEDSKDDWRQEITEFTYNPDGTLKLIANYGDFDENGIIDDEERSEALEWKTEFRYDTANKKVYTESTEYEEKSETVYIKTGELTLNAEGYAVEAKYESNNDGSVETYQISYQDGYAVAVKAIELDDDSSYPYVEEPKWEAGNLVKVSCKRGPSLFGYTDVTYGNELNRSDVSLDLNFVIANTEWYDCFCEDGNYGLKVCGLFGKRSKNMMIKEKEIDYLSSGLTQERSYTYTYENDTKGFITKITVDNNNGGPQSNSNGIYTINYKK